jgi:small GTP-binding protein
VRLLTAPGCGGIAVVAATTAAERRALLASLRTGAGAPVDVAAGAPPRRACLVLDGLVLDEVLVVDRGESGLEVHTHGSPALLAALAARLGPLQPAEVSPAYALLQQSLSTGQLQFCLEQLSCDFDAFLDGVEAMPPRARAIEVAAALERSRAAQALCEPHRLVLVGRQNAGKSTLFNRLLFRERALTGTTAGLTRDPIAEITTLAGYPYEVVDTAGEGDVADGVDRRALHRARELRGSGEPVLVVDGHAGPSAADVALHRPPMLVVATKDDLGRAPWPSALPCDLRLCCGDAGAAPAVRAAVGEALRARRGLPPAGPVGGPAALTQGQRQRLLRLASAAGAPTA